VGDIPRIVPGAMLGDLKIEKELGSGAFATVYLATDTLLGRTVALKVNRFPDALAEQENRAPILREARLVSKLNSPNIVTLYRVHGAGNDWVFEMEYVDGGSLADLVNNGRRLPLPDLIRILRGILAGLDSAHRHGVIHRDVKPANVLLARDGMVKLTDFGLGRQLDETSLSSSGEGMLGTPLYMSPEVVMGEPPTSASDIWSVGIVLHEMLAGKPPFQSKNLPALFQAICNNEPAPLTRAVPPELAELVRRCLSKDPGFRPGSAAEMLERLERMTTGTQQLASERAAPYAHAGLIGRNTELGRLEGWMDSVVAGRGTTVLISGSAGIGKTALAQQVAERAQEKGFEWIEVQLTPFGGLVRPLFDSARHVLQAKAPQPLDRIVTPERFGPGAPVLKSLLLDEAPSFHLQSPQQTLWAIEQLFLGLSKESPVGLLVEDVHLAGSEDLSVIKELGRRLAGMKVLLLLTHRSQEPDASDRGAASGMHDLHALANLEFLDLDPLGSDDIYRLLEERSGGRVIDPEVAQLILEKSEGNPLFATVLFRHLRETDAIARDDTRVRPGPNWGRRDLPRRFHELVEQRVDGLPESQRALLDVAAVDGLEFDGEALAAVLDRPLLSVLRDLQRLYRERGLVQHRELGYRFAHAVFRDVVYRDLAPDLRHAIHKSLAQHLEQRSDHPVDPERLGMHWERAGEQQRAIPHLIRAANEAGARQEIRRTIDLCARAGLVPGKIDPQTAVQQVETLFQLATALSAAERKTEMEEVYEALLQGAADASDRALEVRTFARLAPQRYQARGLSSEDEQRLGMASEELPPGLERGLAHWILGVVAKNRGDVENARRRLLCAEAEFVAVGAASYHAIALDALAGIALRAGELDDAERLYGDAVSVFETAGRRTNAALSRINQVLISFGRGELEGIADHLTTSIRDLDVEGAVGAATHARVILAEARYAVGDVAAAKDAVTYSLEALRRINHPRGLCSALLVDARLSCICGHLDSARDTVAKALAIARKIQDLESEVTALALDSIISCCLGRPDHATRQAREATARATSSDQARLKTDLLLWLAEATIYGLDPEVLLDADPRLRSESSSSLAGDFVAGALAYAEENQPEDLLCAADALESRQVGERRAAHRLTASILRAAYLARSGQPDEAGLVAEGGLKAARQLGHCWAELVLLGVLGELGDVRIGERERVLEEVGARLADGADRERVVRRWR